MALPRGNRTGCPTTGSCPRRSLPWLLAGLLFAGHVFAADVWQPAPGLTWQIQFAGLPVNQSVDAQVFDIDGFDNDASVVASLHAQGRKVVAYLDAGSWESYRPDAAAYPAEVLGNALDGYPDERWVDVRRLDVLGPILAARMDMAKAKGFDAVDFDNVDGYTNSPGFPFTAGDQLAFNRFLADAAHARGLAVGLKNDLDQVGDLVGSFDFAVNEQCFQYHESKRLKPFVAAGKAVFVIEYEGTLESFCAKAHKLGYSAIKKRLSLNAWRKVCR